jgi:hypothetical protein
MVAGVMAALFYFQDSAVTNPKLDHRVVSAKVRPEYLKEISFVYDSQSPDVSAVAMATIDKLHIIIETSPSPFRGSSNHHNKLR